VDRQGPSAIAVIAPGATLLVAFLAGWVTLAVARRQARVMARETWMRELREKAAVILAGISTFARLRGAPDSDERDRRLDELRAVVRPSFNALFLLLAERGEERSSLALLQDSLAMSAGPELISHLDEFRDAVAARLKQERAAITAETHLWRMLWS
jgi:hypothetical protein